MLVKVIHEFKDKENNLKLRKTGEQIVVTKERAKKLCGMGLVQIVPKTKQKKERTRCSE